MPDLSGTRRRRRRDVVVAFGVLLVAFVLLLGPMQWSRTVRQFLRTTVLWPLTSLNSWMTTRRAERDDLREVRAQRDSLAAVLAAQAVLGEENARLRALLSLSQRAGSQFRPAQLLRLGSDAAEGTFLIDAGAEQGVVVGSPVLTVGGLVGVVREVYRRSAQAIDWTHQEFRVSAMTADGQVYGIVEPRRGAFREADLLVMTGAPFHSDVRPGSRIVTSGRGAVFPRGVPIGQVQTIADADTGWRKSYVVRPSVRPEEATHVLVGLSTTGTVDLSEVWDISASRETRPAGNPPAPARSP